MTSAGSRPPATGESAETQSPEQAAHGAARRTVGRVAAAVGPMLSALAVAVGVWYAVTYLVLAENRRFMLPPVHQVLEVSVLQSSHMTPMLQALWLTVQVAVLGLVIAVALGVTQAIVMVQSRWMERILYPYAVILQTMPILALVPLLGIWLGYGFGSRVVVCVLIALFPMISNTLFGLQSPSAAAHDLFTLKKASRWQRLTKLQLPAAVPSIFSGLRISAGLSVIGAIVGDYFFRQGPVGIGGLLDVYTQRLQTEDLFTAIGLASLFGVVVFSLFATLDRAVVGHWYGMVRR
ncbi:ABC transporter permease [Phytoactinopolyspora halotolerans]|uniref:ABC transporter permease n=2 Tax=Phytoactinopolyspora halotolerans TaxID=1981512 RepID=A0A6L9SH24_9ACTN|nr:ABC transporter permease [Phytoactinopolyspora halotolerans]